MLEYKIDQSGVVYDMQRIDDEMDEKVDMESLVNLAEENLISSIRNTIEMEKLNEKMKEVNENMRSSL